MGNEVENGVAVPWGETFKFNRQWNKKANACAPVTPEARDIKDYKILRHINNLETWSLTFYSYENKGLDINERFDVLREQVVALLDENATLQAERDSRFALAVVKRSEEALSFACNYLTEHCSAVSKSKYRDMRSENKYFKKEEYCCKKKVWSDYQFFGMPSGTHIVDSKACEDEATWEAEGDAW